LYKWDPTSNEPDPNLMTLNLLDARYIQENEKYDDDVEVGYNPIFGLSNPIDTCTILGAYNLYMIDDLTWDDGMLTPHFHSGDPEIDFNQNVNGYPTASPNSGILSNELCTKNTEYWSERSAKENATRKLLN
jgi:hypothetical protein